MSYNIQAKEYIDESRNWHYQSITAIIKVNGIEKQFCYGSIDKGESRFLEIYQGENYIVGSTDKSRSWKYNEERIPKKWKEVSSVLKLAFNEKF